MAVTTFTCSEQKVRSTLDKFTKKQVAQNWSIRRIQSFTCCRNTKQKWNFTQLYLFSNLISFGSLISRRVLTAIALQRVA